MTNWFIFKGDILDLRADGLICSANPSLNLSGGVGGAFLLQYGSQMQDFLHAHLQSTGRRIIEPGQVVMAPPCGSPFAAVAHAVAVGVFYETNAHTIRTAYQNALEQLVRANCRTVVAACLGCGYGRCSISEFVESVTDLARHPFPPLESVTFATTNTDLAHALTKIFKFGKRDDDAPR